MTVAVWPIEAMCYPLDMTLSVEAFTNKFGSGYEQRIIRDLPRGPRANGINGLTTFVGRNSTIRVTLKHLRYGTDPIAGTDVDNSIYALWTFYQARFYDSTNKCARYESFYWYNPVENDDVTTWKGDTVANGTNSRGEAVTNETGRYRVKFKPEITRSQFVRQIFNVGLELEEVVS